MELPYKVLERPRGFLCHLAMVYDMIFPFLKEYHLDLAKHLLHRDEEGWKLTDLNWIAHLETQVQEQRLTQIEAETMKNLTLEWKKEPHQPQLE